MILLIYYPSNYEFCDPGTRLDERLARGDRDIKRLDHVESMILHVIILKI